MKSPILGIAFFASICWTAIAGIIHPGLLHSSEDFDRIVGKLDACEEPWVTGWNKLTSNPHAASTYLASPQATVYRGASVKNLYSENYNSLYNDAAAAYALAIRWKVSGDDAYADTSMNILNGWADTLVEINGTSDKYLASGLYGYQLANAAEILREYDDVTAVGEMLSDVFYPMNHDFLVNHNQNKIDHYWANWDLANIATMQAIGVLTDNSCMYQEAMDYLRNGGGNGQISKAVWKLYTEHGSGKILGQSQEAGRDQGHALLDFSLLGVIAQQSNNQGDGVFAYLDNRILAGAEYIAKYNLGYDVPYTTYNNSDVIQRNIGLSGRGGIRPEWELLYAHYGVRKGLNASYTKSYRDLVVGHSGGAEGGGGDYASTSGGYDQLGHGTLLYRLEV